MKVYNLLNKHQRWVKGTEAKTSTGDLCSPSDKEACRFCAVGALERCYPTNFNEMRYKVERVLSKMTDGAYKNIVSFNDDKTTTFKDVVKVFRKANV